jgi:hypothetical protein
MATSLTIERPTVPAEPICACPDGAVAATSQAQLREAVYAEFLYGRGDAPGVNLGRSIAYTRTGSVYRHEFEGGVTLANVSDVPVDFYLGRGYLDLGYVLRRYVVIPPHSGEILLSCGRKAPYSVG